MNNEYHWILIMRIGGVVLFSDHEFHEKEWASYGTLGDVVSMFVETCDATRCDAKRCTTCGYGNNRWYRKIRNEDKCCLPYIPQFFFDLIDLAFSFPLFSSTVSFTCLVSYYLFSLAIFLFISYYVMLGYQCHAMPCHAIQYCCMSCYSCDSISFLSLKCSLIHSIYTSKIHLSYTVQRAHDLQ